MVADHANGSCIFKKKAAYTMYKKVFIELRSDWKNKVHMVITSNNKDDEKKCKRQ